MAYKKSIVRYPKEPEQTCGLKKRAGTESDPLAQELTEAEEFYKSAVVAQQHGDHKSAEQLLLKAIQNQPNFAQGWFRLGNLYQVEKKFLEAVEAYWQAISLHPESPPLFNNLGYALQQLGRWDEASLCYKQALDLQPHFPEADVNLGNALCTLGKLSSEQKIQLGKANYQLGLHCWQAHNFETARLYFQQATALLPTFPDTLIYLGMTLAQLQELEKAERCCQEALKLHPDPDLITTCVNQIEQQKQQRTIHPLSTVEPTEDRLKTTVKKTYADVKSDIKILNKVSGALVNWAKTGFAVVDETVYQKRLSSCRQCPNLAEAPPKLIYRVITANQTNEKICQLCGCVISKKAQIASETCPAPHPDKSGLNRWEEKIPK